MGAVKKKTAAKPRTKTKAVKSGAAKLVKKKPKKATKKIAK